MLLLLLACGSERGVRAAPDEVTYGGWVYEGPPSGEVVLADGALTFTLPGAEPVAAEQPYAGYPGYWLATLPPGVPFQLRVEGANVYPTVWAGDTPEANGTWLAGAVFAGEKGYVDGLFESLELGSPIGALDRGAVHLWGLPNDAAAWDCAAIRVQDTAPVCFAADETGALVRVTEGPVDWFFAFDLAPGEVVLDDGSGPIETWTAAEGDLVMAFWLEHG
ncbi:MAG: hypothetical protein ACK4YP_15540 [Myxococcota bacterium]